MRNYLEGKNHTKVFRNKSESDYDTHCAGVDYTNLTRKDVVCEVKFFKGYL